MGIEPYLISASLVGVISQRLLRKVCSNCRVPYEIEPHHLAVPGFEELAGVTLYRGKGVQRLQLLPVTKGVCLSMKSLWFQGSIVS